MKGVLAAALTPMRDDLSVDREAFSAHCHRLLEAGCHGLAIFGTTGEANSLSVRERIEAWELLVADGVPAETLLPGTGACALPDAVELSRSAIDVGAAGVLALPPFYYKGVSDAGLFRFFAELIERVGDDRLRLFLYHIPPMAVVGFTPELMRRLADAYPGVVVGTKDSSGDATRIERICREFPDLIVFAGTEKYLLDTLNWGGDGCISATVNVTAGLAREVYDAFEAGEDASALQAALTERREYLDGFPTIPALKALLGWEHLRPPLQPLDAELARTISS
jgi:4-hydroxy-tetrahydrodipicolinate synthase